MTRIPTGGALALALALATLPARAEDPACADETSASVPALSAFHEVIYPMWHTAWASKDTAMVRELWPDLQTHVTAVEKAELPGILRDKKEAWAKGLQRLQAAEAAYGAALEGEAIEPKLAAVEEMHAAFESLVRTIRPILPELQAFHEVLYRIYHYDLPNRDETALGARLPALTAAMDTLNTAVLPERRAAAKENFEAARAELSARVEEVAKITTEDDWTQTAKAIEDMHTAYQAVEKVFE
jgi:hypothetical protein